MHEFPSCPTCGDPRVPLNKVYHWKRKLEQAYNQPKEIRYCRCSNNQEYQAMRRQLAYVPSGGEIKAYDKDAAWWEQQARLDWQKTMTEYLDKIDLEIRD